MIVCIYVSVLFLKILKRGTYLKKLLKLCIDLSDTFLNLGSLYNYKSVGVIYFSLAFLSEFGST